MKIDSASLLGVQAGVMERNASRNFVYLIFFCLSSGNETEVLFIRSIS
jgi:hypothetical protein